MEFIRTQTQELPRKLTVNAIDFVRWQNVWLLAQTLIVLQALSLSWHMPLKMLVIALATTWILYQANKF